MCQSCEDFAAGLIDAVTADVCSDAERGEFGPYDEGDWDDLAIGFGGIAEAEDDGE